MKLKFRAEKKDVIAFAVISVFMLYLVCLCVLNFSFIINEGTPWGLNPFLAFTPKYIGVTIMLWIASIAFTIAIDTHCDMIICDILLTPILNPSKV